MVEDDTIEFPGSARRRINPAEKHCITKVTMRHGNYLKEVTNGCAVRSMNMHHVSARITRDALDNVSFLKSNVADAMG